jgi:hypothetical protein
MLSDKAKCPFCEFPCGMEHCPYTSNSEETTEIIDECGNCLKKIQELQEDNLYLNELLQQLHDKIHE